MKQQQSKYYQRRFTAIGTDEWGFPILGKPIVRNVARDKRRFLTQADVTELWIANKYVCTHVKTFTGPYYTLAWYMATESKKRAENE